MAKYLIVGADVHEEYVMIKWAVNQGNSHKLSFRMSFQGQQKMIESLKLEAQKAGAPQIVFAYEACCMGFGLYDNLTEASIKCHVLAPTKITRSNKQKRSKCDEKDAEHILEILKAHLLAGNSLPDVWIPDHQTRQDRLVVRRRLELSDKLTAVKTQIGTILKKAQLRRPKEIGTKWTKAYMGWLHEICDAQAGVLQYGSILSLESRLRELEMLEKEIEIQDENIKALSKGERYREAATELCKLRGVGLLTAMTFLTEMGDMSRFSNRKQIGAYFGLSPSSYETGENSDKKGHITKQGSGRLRKVLSQASWCRTSVDPAYDRIVSKNPNKKKKALVALMRRLGIIMWHIAKDVQERTGCFKNSQPALT